MAFQDKVKQILGSLPARSTAAITRDLSIGWSPQLPTWTHNFNRTDAEIIVNAHLSVIRAEAMARASAQHILKEVYSW